MKKGVIGSMFALLIALSLTFPAKAEIQGFWEQAENEKWMYFYQPGEPVKDQWIEHDGKTYYMDSSGYMKTGWVVNKEDGIRYYLGPDGAMCFNTYAPDGRYAGPEGSEMKAYDNYRKKVRNSLKSAQKSRWYKDASELGLEPVFLLTDLNEDGYKDLVIKDQGGAGSRVMSIAVWDQEEEKLLEAADFDLADSGDGGQGAGTVYRNWEKQEIWLQIQGNDGSLELFSMVDGSPRFEHWWSFTVGLDKWGGAEYLVNGDPVTREEWENEKARALEEMGGSPLEGFAAFTEDNINGQVDPVLTEEELALWQS